MIIRRLETLADYRDFLQLRLDNPSHWVDNQHEPFEILRHSGELRFSPWVLVAHRDNPAGYVAAIEQEGTIRVHSILTDTNHRGTGVARTLIGRLETMAREANARIITGTPVHMENSESAEFFNSSGYKFTHIQGMRIPYKVL
ncbi:MAG: GNAT family N-acetyltransferase [Candidatus Woesearchaeota archaeon]